MPTQRNRYYSTPIEKGRGTPQFNYVWSQSTIITGSNYDITGCWVVQNNGGEVTVSNTTPSGANFNTGQLITGQVLPENPDRSSWFIQNTSNVSPLYVAYGQSASSSTYNLLLAPATASGYGGGQWYDENAKWRGSVYVSGAGQFISWEL